MSEDNGVLQRFNEMITKSQVLKKHANSIWQGTGKDKRWKTTIANNRVIAKNTERELLEYLANYYDMSRSYTLTSNNNAPHGQIFEYDKVNQARKQQNIKPLVPADIRTQTLPVPASGPVNRSAFFCSGGHICSPFLLRVLCNSVRIAVIPDAYPVSSVPSASGRSAPGRRPWG